jgi:hypothetical protein
MQPQRSNWTLIKKYFPEMGVNDTNELFQSMNARIISKSWLARLAAWKLGVPQVALTLGSTVHLHRTDASCFLADPAWVRHELKHVEQFRAYGFLRFLILYGWESLWKGYYQNRFEVEARAAEQETMPACSNAAS